MSDGSKAYEQALRGPTTRRASRTRLLWGTSRFLRAHGRLKTSLKALWFATTFSLRQAPSGGNSRRRTHCIRNATIEIRVLRDGMTTRTQLLEIIANGESSGVEFKRDVIVNHQLARELVAFSNLTGGMVLLGVDDDGSLSGLTRTDLEEWVM